VTLRDRLSSLLGRRAGSGFYESAETLRRIPDGERAVAEAALDGDGLIAADLLAQLRRPPDVWRRIDPDGRMELRISTTAGIAGVPRSGWRSRPIPVRAMPGDRVLELTLVVPQAGILELEGRALDSRAWPRSWSVAPASLEAIRAGRPWLVLPTPAETVAARAGAISIVEGWLGAPGALTGARGVVAVEGPATPETIAALEAAQGFPLPEAYRALLLVANGVEIGDLAVLGTDDAYRLDMPGPDRLVIAPPDEDGALVLGADGSVRFVAVEATTGEGVIRGPDLRTWLRGALDSARRG
jgi:hypothetical protein